MRSLKMILAGLFAAVTVAAAVVAGFFAAAVVAAVGLAVYVVRRLLGRPTASPPRSDLSAHKRPADATDVIEVTATEVSADQPER